MWQWKYLCDNVVDNRNISSEDYCAMCVSQLGYGSHLRLSVFTQRTNGFSCIRYVLCMNSVIATFEVVYEQCQCYIWSYVWTLPMLHLNFHLNSLSSYVRFSYVIPTSLVSDMQHLDANKVLVKVMFRISFARLQLFHLSYFNYLMWLFFVSYYNCVMWHNAVGTCAMPHNTLQLMHLFHSCYLYGVAE